MDLLNNPLQPWTLIAFAVVMFFVFFAMGQNVEETLTNSLAMLREGKSNRIGFSTL